MTDEKTPRIRLEGDAWTCSASLQVLGPAKRPVASTPRHVHSVQATPLHDSRKVRLTLRLADGRALWIDVPEDTCSALRDVILYGEGRLRNGIGAEEEVPEAADAVATPTAAPPRPFRVGDAVRVGRGFVGDGHRFTIEEIGVDGFGEPIVYGNNYGPRWVREIELVAAVEEPDEPASHAEPADEEPAELDASAVSLPAGYELIPQGNDGQRVHVRLPDGSLVDEVDLHGPKGRGLVADAVAAAWLHALRYVWIPAALAAGCSPAAAHRLDADEAVGMTFTGPRGGGEVRLYLFADCRDSREPSLVAAIRGGSSGARRHMLELLRGLGLLTGGHSANAAGLRWTLPPADRTADDA